MEYSYFATCSLQKVKRFDGTLTISYEELEPSASLHNAIFKILDNQPTICAMFSASLHDCRVMLIESFLNFCEMTRLCGNVDDLLAALAKTGFLEQKFDQTKHYQDVYPAVLAERAEILWKRDKKVEAIQALRSLVNGPDATKFSFRLIPKELIFANLVSPISFDVFEVIGVMDI
jgi:hypothetical protein